MQRGELYWWDVLRVLSSEELDAIDQRLEAAKAEGRLDEEQQKKENQKSDIRPVLILRVSGKNAILAMCTSKDHTEHGAIEILPSDLVVQTVRTTTYLRPDRIWTDNIDWARNPLGTLKPQKFAQVCAAVKALFD
jgi:mRNA-degrading endonuclease toxin of MazEF toxin-antitoxin module